MGALDASKCSELLLPSTWRPQLLRARTGACLLSYVFFVSKKLEASSSKQVRSIRIPASPEMRQIAWLVSLGSDLHLDLCKREGGLKKISVYSLLGFDLAGCLTAVPTRESLAADLKSHREQVAAVAMSNAIPRILEVDETLP